MARLRLGVIGIGRRWKAALASLRSEARIVAGDGVIDLLRRPGLDALLLGRAWFGLWPLPHAIEAGKPVLCLASPLAGEAVLDEIAGRDGSIRFAPWPALELVARPLADALAPLGPARLLQASWTHPANEPPLAHPHALALFRLAASLLGDPVGVKAMAGACLLDHGEGRASQFLFGKGTRPACHLRVEAEAGGASVEMPGRLAWRDAAGRHERHLPSGMANLAVLESFLADVRAGRPLGGIGPALGWLRQARP